MAIKLNIITAFDDKELKRAQREIAAVGKSISRSLNLAVGAATIGAVAGLTDAVKAASNYAAEFEGVNQIFKEAAGTVQAFAKTAATSAGMSETMALRAAKSFGGFATAAGLSGQAAAGFATNLVQAAADLGSFFDVPVDDALAAIKSGLAGETEPLKKFNILLNDSSLRAEAMSMKLIKTTKEALTPQQKVLAANSLILKGLGVAQGDFVNYQDTFGNAIKTITAEFQDMQRQIGEQLLPILESILPTVRELIPVLGEKLKAAVASVDWKAFFEGIVTSISFLIENGKQIAILIGTLFALNKAFAAIRIGIDVTNLSMALLNGTIAINPFAVVIGSIAVMTAGLVGLGIAAFDANNAVANMNSTYYGRGSSRAAGPQAASAARGAAGYASRYAGMEAMGAALGLGATSKTADAAQALKDQLAAIAAATKGAVSASDLKKAASARAAAAKKAAAETAKAEKEMADAVQKAAEEAKKAYDDLKASIDEFNKSFEKTAKGFEAVFKLTPILGAFEQQAVDAFDTIKQSAQDAFDSKLISKTALASLTAYADQEKALLIGIAKQRDVLAKKISIAQAVTSGVMGSLNITSMLQTETKQVTQSVTKMIDGIALTTTKTFDEVVSGGLTESFRKLVDKTKAFATNLNKLKSLGLNGTLFKQIVDAGAEGGNATAEAIIAGGASAVTELNGLFKELSDAGTAIAETTTPVLYALGEDITNSFIEGLRSQDQMLIDSATAMAALFTGEFKKQLGSAMSATLNLAGANAGIYPNDTASFVREYSLANAMGTTSMNRPTVNVTVNANTITDKDSLPFLVTNALLTANKQGLTNGLSRVLAL